MPGRYKPYTDYKSSGIEWLGDIPVGWDVLRLSSLFFESSRRAESLEEAAYPILSVSIHHGISDKELDEKELDRKVSRSDDKSLYKVISKNDLAYNMMRAWQGGFGASTLSGLVSPAYVVCKPTSKVPSDFFERVLRTPNAIIEMKRFSRGITDFRLRLYWDEFKNIVVPVPPSGNDVSKIIDFLDHETAKIDALITKQERLIELLEEKRQAVISHAVTKGLNPDAPMRPSGIDWLGDVPEHWDLMALSRLTLEKCDGPFGSGLKSDHYTEIGARVIRLQNIRSAEFDDGNSAFIDEKYFAKSLSGHDVLQGDVLIAGLGDERNLVGRACVAPSGIEPALVKADCFRFRVDESRLNSRFAALQLSMTAVVDSNRLANGTTRSRIPLSAMAGRTVIVPPLVEQVAIVSLVDEQLSKYEQAKGAAINVIALLKERRTALISAAVTGKIDVRDWEPPSPISNRVTAARESA